MIPTNLEDNNCTEFSTTSEIQSESDILQESIKENIEQTDLILNKLRDISQLVHEDKIELETVRTILSWFGAKRRGISVVNSIQKALAEVHLKTEPDFTRVYMDAQVRFVPIQQLNIETSESQSSQNEASFVSNIEFLSATWKTTPSEFVSGAIGDPTFRIEKLASANRTPTTVTPNTTLDEATTLMILQDFSQLPVMQNEREVKGVISWESIGKCQSLGRQCKEVRDCMEIEVPEVPYSSSLLSAIDIIVKYGYVIVRQTDKKISGIVTTTDLSLQFRQLAEPFILVGEIENYIRRLIDGKFTIEQLSSVRDPNDDKRHIDTVADLTFGEYLRLLEKPDNWEHLKIPVHRQTFIKHLDVVRDLRNDVMHFNPDPFDEEALEKLRLFANFMRILDNKKD
jgi:CBS domain-containing protein